MNFYEVYENFRNIFLFFNSYIDFSFEKLFLMIFGRFFFFFSQIDFLFQNFFVYECSWSLCVFLKDFFFWVIYWFFISYSMAQRTPTEVLRILRPRTERVNYLDYLYCLKVMNFLVNVFLFQKSANWHLKLKHFFCSHQVCDFFRLNTLLQLYNASSKI